MKLGFNQATCMKNSNLYNDDYWRKNTVMIL